MVKRTYKMVIHFYTLCKHRNIGLKCVSVILFFTSVSMTYFLTTYFILEDRFFPAASVTLQKYDPLFSWHKDSFEFPQNVQNR